jgi:hypothetical protein
MKKLIFDIVTTNTGWITRQALKGLTIAAAALATWLSAKGVDATTTATISVGLISAASWLIETGLSYVARKYTVL